MKSQIFMCFVECNMHRFFSKPAISKQTAMLNKPSEPQWLRLCQHLSVVFLGTTVQLEKIYPSLKLSSKINQSLPNLEEKMSDNLSCTGMKVEHENNDVSGSILHILDNEDIFKANPTRFQCNLSSSYLRHLYSLPRGWTLPVNYRSKSCVSALVSV